MNDIVNKGIKSDEIKRELIVKFKENDPADYQDIDPSHLKSPLVDQAKPNPPAEAPPLNEQFKSLRSHFNTNFEQKDVHKFDNPSWVCAQLAMRLSLKDSKLEILYNLLCACTFN